MSFFIIALTFLNIGLWIVFFIRFKKIFSTDKIIDETRDQMNRMIKDIDSATDRDMYLVREATKNIKGLLEDADRKMEEFSIASMRLRDMIAETEKQGKSTAKKSTVYTEYEKTQPVRKSITNPQIEQYLRNSKASSKSNPENSYEVVQKNQPDLFNQETTSSVLKDETIVTKDGAAYKEVPLIITEIYEDKPNGENEQIIENSIPEVHKEKSLKSQVSNLYNQGYKSEEIAQALGCSITEVDFIIDML